MGYRVIWLDITDLKKWRGELTGVQRVALEFAKRSKASDIEFFSYDGIRFNRESRKKFDKFGDGGFHSFRRVPRSEATQAGRISLRFKKIYAAGREFLLSFVPDSIRLKLRLWSTTRQQDKLDEQPHGHVSSPFRPDDTVLFLGASWSTSSLRAMALTKVENVTMVSMIYDLTPILFPHFFGPGFGDYFAGEIVETLQLSASIIVISRSTKNDVTRFAREMGIKCPPVDVVRLGDSPSTTSFAQAQGNVISEIDGEFVLSVGTLEIRKNFDLLVDVWALAEREGITLPVLVIVGRAGWLTADLQYRILHQAPLNKKILWLQNCSDQDLRQLYRKCLFTIYPSHYEGWGLPVAESLHHGKICLCSSTSSMPEIAGTLIPYLDEFDVVGRSHRTRQRPPRHNH